MSASLPQGICPECRTAELASGRQTCQACAALALIYTRPGITRPCPAGRLGAPE
jgi:hypothetical protein